MQSLFITLTLLLISFSCVADDVFKPFIIEGKDLAVCNFALKHYQNIYEGSDTTTTGIKSGREIYVPELESVEIQDSQGKLAAATIEIENTQKTVAFFSRELGWRGLIHTGYMINPSELDNLKKQLKESDEKETIKHFYPMGELAYGSNFSWWLNIPFQYQDNWYVLGDFGDFTRHNAIRNVYKIGADSSSLKMCSIQIYKNYEPQRSNENLPYFAAYINSVETMLVSSGDCGTSHPEAAAKDRGNFFVSSALIRPWSISNPIKPQHKHDITEKQLQNHLDHWKYTDVWTYRENESFTYLKIDAERELTEYYISKFGYQPKNAEKLAQKVVTQTPLSYYSLGSYHDSSKDFSPFQNMAAGKFNEWSNIDAIMKLHYGKVDEIAFTLMLDNPEQLRNIPESYEIKKIETEYRKNLLMYAAHINNYDSTEWLIKSGFQINQATFFKTGMCAQFPERTNRSALTYAVENSSIHLIRLLIEAGEKPDIVDTKGNDLNFYLSLNPRFTTEEKKLGLSNLLEKYKNTVIKPSFSCSAKVGKIESAICSSKGLSIYDDELSKLYGILFSSSGIDIKVPLKQSQINWLRQRNKDCTNSTTDGELKGCIARTTRSRIRYLEYLNKNLKTVAAIQQL